MNLLTKTLNKIFKSGNQQELDKIKPLVNEINAKEKEVSHLKDTEFKEKTQELKKRISGGENLDSVIPQSFALVREAAKRVLSERHYDVQLAGGIILHKGKIAEMKTGEGKTLVSTLPAYLNSLSNKGVHIVTVNDYLAKRDSEWMGKIYNFLGVSTGCIVNDLDDIERKKNYNCDITYATNNELGFDYLRDNMKYGISEMVQRNHNYCIVDEVDSILIDESRTPLIISGQSEDKSNYYVSSNGFMNKLEKSDYELDEKNKNAMLSDKGIDKVEKLSRIAGILKNDNFYDPQNLNLVHHVNQALRANFLFRKDTDYIVKDGRVQIIDEFTGRILEGRRFSDGLHQALEAKESVEIQQENQTLASITYQNYFRLYNKLSGMTGTALTEAEEFFDIYKLNVVSVPTNKDMIRKDTNDQIFRTEKEKHFAILNKIIECKSKGQPVLVGTTSIEKSEKISKLLENKKIEHNVLNAKHHEQEAKIVAEAGKEGAITIATNMAGRGTDIQLGGNKNIQLEDKKINLEQIKNDKKKVKSLGGLYIIGTERHESRRIDNQLRGRSGRQGDPGYTRLYVSFDDELMRRFAPDWLSTTMEKIGMSENTPIESKMVTRSIETAQSRVESNNFEARKYILEYDDVMNIHRQKIYSERDSILSGLEMEDKFFLLSKNEFDYLLSGYQAGNSEVNHETQRNLLLIFGEQYNDDIQEILRGNEQQVLVGINELFKQKYESIFKNYAKQDIEQFIQYLMLSQIDQLWVQHLTAMDEMRRGIGLRAYGQLDPLVAFKKEALSMWEDLGNSIRTTILRAFHIQSLNFNHSKTEPTISKALNIDTSKEDNIATQLNIPDKIGRNSPCPCGSGLKYKKCCGLK